MAPKDEGVEVNDAPKKTLRHGDPFEVREGKTLTWRNINMILVRFSPNKRKSFMSAQLTIVRVSLFTEI